MTRQRLSAHACDDPDTFFGPIDAEPTASEYAAARAELGAWASDEQITQRAFELMAESLADFDANADEHDADNYGSRYDD